MLAIIGAVREEIADLQRHMLLEAAFAGQDCHTYKGKYEKKDVLLVQTGLGKERAERATKFILEHHPITTLVSVGFAGALTEELKVGDIILCSTLYCGNGEVNGEIRPANPCHSDTSLVSLSLQTMANTATRLRQGTGVTVTHVVSRPEAKQALGKVFHAHTVDMESYWIARMAATRQIPFLAVRVISDTMRDSLPSFDQLLDPSATWRWKRAAPFLISHPRHLIKLFTLYWNTQQARKSLTAFIDHLVASY